MKAFLLTAGLGTRLRPLTDKIPKCLLPIGSKPLLQIWLETLAKQGVDEVLLNTHWLSQKVEAFLATWAGEKPLVRLFHEPTLLGSGGTLLANREWVKNEDAFCIIYGDNLSDVDLRAMRAFHLQHGLPFTLGVFKTLQPEYCGIAEVDEQGLVVGFVEKPSAPKSDLAAAGIYLADQRIFEYFPPGRGQQVRVPLDLGFHVLPRLVGQMRPFLINQVIDIGTPESYARAGEIWQAKCNG